MHDDYHLTPNVGSSWATGLRNMLREENAKWWNPIPMATQIIIWTVVINGFLAMVMLTNYYSPSKAEIVNNGLMNFFNLSAIVMPLGAIIIGHSSMLRERESGTAAWLLSKPLTRKAFVTSKLLANTAGFLVIVVLSQGVIAYAQCSYVLGEPVSIRPFFEGICVLGIACLFYLVLTIAISTFSMSRSLALGFPVLLTVAGLFVTPSVSVPKFIIPSSMVLVYQNSPIPEMTVTSVVVAAMVMFISAAVIWKFDRTEL